MDPLRINSILANLTHEVLDDDYDLSISLPDGRANITWFDPSYKDVGFLEEDLVPTYTSLQTESVYFVPDSPEVPFGEYGIGIDVWRVGSGLVDRWTLAVFVDDELQAEYEGEGSGYFTFDYQGSGPNCRDAPDDRLFFVSAAYPAQNCLWLSKNPQFIESECNVAIGRASFYCPCTCGMCSGRRLLSI